MNVQTKIASAASEAAQVLQRLGVPAGQWTGGNRAVRSPVTGEIIANVHDNSEAEVAAAIDAAHTTG